MQSVVFLIVLFSFSLAGFFFDELFRPLKPLIVPLLIVIMLSMGITLTPEDFKRIFKRPQIILYGALLQFSVMPLTGFLLAKLLRLSPELVVGVVLVGSAPGGTASNLMTYISGGELSYSISMTTVSTLLSPIFTPLWTWLLAGKLVPVPFLDMAITTLKVVVFPVLGGMLIRGFVKEKLVKIESLLPYLSITAISLIIAVIFALNKEKLQAVSLLILSVVILHNLTGFVLGFLFGKLAGLDNKLAKTLSIEVGMQNSGLSTVLALKFFSQLSALPSAVFSLSQNILGVLLSVLFRRI
ncbi:BASS family bile acid:Na+ symporter [Hydrogenivirga caldilitoris]|uniref:BASS family bile acid:Na+ symporter n=1 Tax=Hydrogenivirga caldilitoris TaxID=246264 RepID=A0A497XQZ3_9AQUI|nr:bile acid:sodium symporter family protein [Hydrogenivirga caldilitoris]RLJ71417.1 BASS family bile acid:Na+ symporter [Hydrogenivirga caldilitoris]